MGKTIGTFNTYTSRGSKGAKMEAADAVRALARRLEIHSEDISLESYPTQANFDSLIRQVTKTIQRLEWAEPVVQHVWNSEECSCGSETVIAAKIAQATNPRSWVKPIEPPPVEPPIMRPPGRRRIVFED